MSTSVLYHGFGIVGYHYVRTLFEAGTIVFRIVQGALSLRSPCCNSLDVKKRGTKTRRFRTVPIGSKPVFVELPVQRVECLKCGAVRRVKVKFAEPRRTYTRSFERYVLDLSKSMTIKDVSDHIGVGWDIVKDIQKRNYGRRFGNPRLKDLKHIAIDEISRAKGHKYLTVVMDLKSGAVVFVGDGKGADALKPFWKKLKISRAKVEAVAIDMSPAYIGAVLENLPGSAIVFDRFHVTKLYNEKLSDIRRQLQHEVEDVLQLKAMKGIRWIILKNPENLDEEKNEKQRLEKALELNAPLAKAYYLKDSLRQFWEQESKEAASEHLDAWIKDASNSGIPQLATMARTLGACRFGLLSYYDYNISTGPLEGTNNKIKTLKRKAYGFRDPEFFKLKIKALNEMKYALVG